MSERAPLSRLPAWPRYLSRDEAARYVGVGVDVFDREVAAGLWPAARRRGAKAARLTWDKHALDLAADKDSGLDQEAPDPITASPWAGRSRDGAAERKRA